MGAPYIYDISHLRVKDNNLAMIMQLIKSRNIYELRKKMTAIAEIWENIIE